MGSEEQNKILTPSSAIKRLLVSLNITSFLLSIPIIFCIVWLLYVREGKCEHVLPLWKLQIVVVVGLAVLFLVSNGVVFLRSRFLMLGLIAVMVPLIFILIIGSTLIGAFRLESRLIPGSPSWLKIMVSNDTNWDDVQSCLYNIRTCQDLVVQTSIVGSSDFPRSHLSPIESGCCIPPSICNMSYVNVNYWEKKVDYDDSSSSYDVDCDIWQNKATRLCYGCYACRKGFIRTLRQKWFNLGVFLIVETVLLTVSHLLLFVATMWARHAS